MNPIIFLLPQGSDEHRWVIYSQNHLNALSHKTHGIKELISQIDDDLLHDHDRKELKKMLSTIHAFLKHLDPS